MLKVSAVSVAMASLLGSAAIASTATVAAPVPPTPNASVSYQLGGDYGPEFASGVVIRDSTSSPIASSPQHLLSQTVPDPADQSKWWKRKHRNLLLRKGAGGTSSMGNGTKFCSTPRPPEASGDRARGG